MAAQPGPVWVGIDVGKRFHHAVAIDVDGTVVWSQRVANDQAAINQLVSRGVDTASEVRWAVDLTSTSAALLLALLLSAEQPVVYVPARVVNRMSDAFIGEGKTDAKDAHVIAQTARLRRDLARLDASDELIVELNLLTRHREDLTADWVRGVNRLRSLLSGVFPALESALDYTTSTALVFILGFCTPEALHTASDADLAAHLATHRIRADRAASVVAKARIAAEAQTVALPGQALSEDLIRQTARRLLDLRRQLKDLDKLITSWHGASARRGVPGHHRRRLERLRHRNPAGDLRRSRPRPTRLRKPQRCAAPAQAIPPSTAARLLHGGLLQHPN
jgi:hypothetical protein